MQNPGAVLDLDNKLVPEAMTLAPEAKAWRILFGTDIPSGNAPLLVVQEPRNVAAFAEAISLDEALADSDDDSFCILWIPPNILSNAERESAWLDTAAPIDGAARDQHIIKAGLRTIRVVWSERRAVIHSAREHIEEAIDAVVRFTLAERETFDLERQMTAIWPILKAHTPLTHKSLASLRRRDKTAVAQVTEQVTQMTATLLLLQTALEQLDPALAGNSKRLYAELVLQAAIYERIELLEDPIEFAMEHYELVNTRMLEAKTASNELWVGAAIIVALVIEIAVIVLQLTLMWGATT